MSNRLSGNVGERQSLASTTHDLPLCTVVIPCRDEVAFIDRCLGSIIASSYPKARLEVLVIDGMSGDGTRQIIQEYMSRYPFVRMLDNPKRVTPAGLNVGVKEALGSVVLRMDAHAEYEPAGVRIADLRAVLAQI